MRVLKFGGTSVGSFEALSNVLDIISRYHKEGIRFCVVVSALGGVTNLLIALGNQAASGDEQYQDQLKELEQRHFDLVLRLIKAQDQSGVFLKVKQLFNQLEDVLQGVYLLKELSPRASDFIVSHGERLSATIIAAAGVELGLPTSFCDTSLLVKTNSNFGAAKVDFELTNTKIQEYFEKQRGIIIATGFIGSNNLGHITTLGRGGSDYTASILAAALSADSVEIWTDVDGVLTADPRKVKEAFTLDTLSYQEAMELSHFGAKVIYPPTLQPVFAKNIPIWIKNTFNASHVGTLISNQSEAVTDSPIRGISSINDVNLINIQGSGMVGVSGTASRIFDSLGTAHVNIILITQASSEHSICLAIAPNDAETAKLALESEFHYELIDGKLDPFNVERGLAIVALIGDHMANVPGVAGRMFASLGENGINIRAIAQGSSERNISAVIEQAEVIKALNVLHDSFFLSDTHTLNIFMVGHGLVGRALLEQMSNQHQYLLNERHLRLNIVGITNSRKMLFDLEGISLEDWEVELDARGVKANIESFVNQMIALNMSNSIFVDNTSNRAIVLNYEKILKENIHIVTPNKTATSSEFSLYKSLKSIANNRGVRFLFETNVGAGLPVISTLQDLIQSGDLVKKIEGVFSGTLSYIFNHYDGSRPFAEIVKEAQNLGYTEPDPREDLSGQDVARKILILSREAGYPLEPEDIQVDSLLPEACLQASSVEAFYKELYEVEHHFKQHLDEANRINAKLRVVAMLENGKASVSLKYFTSEHPFYGLSGSDNMIAYTTTRYYSNPLVVRGPGAGAAVTAAGVFSDIIRSSKR